MICVFVNGNKVGGGEDRAGKLEEQVTTRVSGCVRQELGQKKSHRNSVKHLDIVEQELSNFTFQLLCFIPVAACGGLASANSQAPTQPLTPPPSTAG